MQRTDEDWMRLALAEARSAAIIGEVPVGAIVLHAQGQVIGRGHNRREIDADPTAHAEMLALREAARTLGGWRLLDCVLYVTQEPCPMCAGALVNARLPRLVYGCDNPKAGSVRSLHRLVDDERFNHRVEVTAGVLAGECGELLRSFFQALRNK